MNYCVDKEIFARVPEFCRGVVVAWDIDNTAPSNMELENSFRARIEEVFAEAVSPEHEKIMAWRQAYRVVGLKDKVRPSVAALVRRIRSGNGNNIPFVSPLVCISNLVTLTYLLPTGIVDLSRVQGDMVLGFAQGGEVFEPIGHEGRDTIEQGEIVFYDSKSRNVICRGWNSRGGKATWILPETKCVILDVDGLLSVFARKEIESATCLAARLLERYCGATTNIQYLDAGNQRFQLAVSN